MHRIARLLVAILFWMVQLWWLGHLVQALRFAPTGTFRVYSVLNNDVMHDGWGLTFTGEAGQALGVAYLALVLHAIVGLHVGRSAMWIGSALILVGWSALFAGNSLWLSQWSRFEWWDWVNLAGVGLVAAQIVLMARRPSVSPALRPSAE